MILSQFDIVLFVFLALSLIVQLVYYWVFLAKPYYYRQKIKNGKIQFGDSKPPVSIIICARDEEESLERYLPQLLEQDYPEYEVIVVNDNSHDGSDDVLKRLAIRYKHFYHTYIPEGTKNISRKKLGLTLGVKAAKYDYLLFTEADNYPLSKNWIASMVRHFSKNQTLVLGLSVLEKKTGFWAKFKAFDYFYANLQMLSMALFNRPYGANGRNWAYKKTHFVEQKGYSKHRFLLDGEDDLFFNEIADKKNIAVELTADSVVVQREKKTFWKEWKLSSLVTHRFYKKSLVAFWRMEQWSRFFFFLSVLACFLYALVRMDLVSLIIAGVAFFAVLFRLFTLLFVINKTANKLSPEKFYFTLPLFDVIQLIVNAYFCVYSLFQKKDKYSLKI